MSGQDAGGLATVLGLLGAAGRVEVEGGEADLFEGAAPLPLAEKGKSGPQGGRPKGARNKSTEEWARMLLGRYRSPLTVLAELYSRPLGELVDELQGMADKHNRWRQTKDGGHWEVVRVDPLAVLKAQQAAAEALAPYLHKQQPKALEIQDKPRGVVLLADWEDAESGLVADDGLLPALGPSEEKQGVKQGAAGSVGNVAVGHSEKSSGINGERANDR